MTPTPSFYLMLGKSHLKQDIKEYLDNHIMTVEEYFSDHSLVIPDDYFTKQSVFKTIYPSNQSMVNDQVILLKIYADYRYHLDSDKPMLNAINECINEVSDILEYIKPTIDPSNNLVMYMGNVTDTYDQINLKSEFLTTISQIQQDFGNFFLDTVFNKTLEYTSSASAYRICLQQELMSKPDMVNRLQQVLDYVKHQNER